MVSTLNINGQVVGTAIFDGEKITATVTVGAPIVATVNFGGVTIHNDLSGRSDADAHPIDAITGLTEELGNKQNSIKFTPEAEPGSFASWVRGVLLTGLGAFTNFAILAEDTLLAAMAKLQGQINSLVTRVGSLENKIIYEEIIENDITAVSYTLTGFSIPPNKPFKIYWDAPANGGVVGNYYLVQLNNVNGNIYQRATSLINGWTIQQGYSHTRSQISMTLLDGDILGNDSGIWNNGGSYARTFDSLGTYGANWDSITSITLLRSATPKIPAGTKIKVFYE